MCGVVLVPYSYCSIRGSGQSVTTIGPSRLVHKACCRGPWVRNTSPPALCVNALVILIPLSKQTVPPPPLPLVSWPRGSRPLFRTLSGGRNGEVIVAHAVKGETPHRWLSFKRLKVQKVDLLPWGFGTLTQTAEQVRRHDEGNDAPLGFYASHPSRVFLISLSCLPCCCCFTSEPRSNKGTNAGNSSTLWRRFQTLISSRVLTWTNRIVLFFFFTGTDLICLMVLLSV